MPAIPLLRQDLRCNWARVFRLMLLKRESITFVSNISKVKSVPRSGWISHGVGLQEVESVADHTFSTAAIAMFLADLESKKGHRIDVERILRMALLHDLAEALTFDISKSYLDYLGRKGVAMKEELEQAAWRHMVKEVRPVSIKTAYARLQSEFNAEETLEAQIVHAADKLDILFQIIEYSRRGYDRAMFNDLWESSVQVLRSFQLSSVHALLGQAIKLRKNGRFR